MCGEVNGMRGQMLLGYKLISNPLVLNKQIFFLLELTLLIHDNVASTHPTIVASISPKKTYAKATFKPVGFANSRIAVAI